MFQESDLVKRRMLRCARMVFARYFFIQDEEKVYIIETVCTDTYGDRFKLSESIKLQHEISVEQLYRIH